VALTARSLFNSTGPDAPRLHVATWLTDTRVYHDALELVVEKARRFWWGQQIDLATVAFSLLLSIEGRRRNIPKLWAYLLLAHLVNLSFAQNLFYLTLLLTPSPLPTKPSSLPTSLKSAVDRVFPTKPANWCPHPGLFLAVLSANYVALFLLPYAAETESFASISLLARLLTFAPITLPLVVPERLGTVHPHPHSAYGAYTSLFRFVSVASFVLHVKGTVLGLAYNLPDSHYHRHSIRIPWDTAERSNWERTTSALGKLLGSTADHPVVAGVGRDVLLSALSLGIWAAVRAVDSNDILRTALPFYNVTTDRLTAKGTGRARPNVPSTDVAANAGSYKENNSATNKSSTARRRKTTRPASIGSIDGLNTDEAGSTPAPKKRGRPKKAAKGDEGDAEYTPSLEEEIDAPEGDDLPTEGMDWESAALAWGLAAVGGLGAAEAGVFGAECIAR
jgi:hypothetical protein